MASFINKTTTRLTPQEVLLFFESQLLKDGVLSARLENLRQGVAMERSKIRSHLIQFLYLVLGLRSVVLFFLPILCAKNELLGLLLGDNVSVMGLAIRQMWYSLIIHYSLLFSACRLTLEWAERRGCLYFFTDYAPHGASSRDLHHIRREMNFCVMAFRIFLGSVYIAVGGVLLLSLTMETMEKKSLTHFCFSLFWSLMNLLWLMFGPRFVLPIVFFFWLATTQVCRTMHGIRDSGWVIMKTKFRVMLVMAVVRLRMDSLFNEIEETGERIERYNRVLQHIFLLFRYLFIPISASACYVLLAGQFPDLLSLILVLLLSVIQLGTIFFCMSHASYPRSASSQIAEVLFSLQARVGHHLSRYQKVRLIKTIHRLTNAKQPIGYTCGEVFPLEARSMMDFMLEIMATTVLFLQIIKQVEPL